MYLQHALLTASGPEEWGDGEGGHVKMLSDAENEKGAGMAGSAGWTGTDDILVKFFPLLHF